MNYGGQQFMKYVILKNYYILKFTIFRIFFNYTKLIYILKKK